MKTLDLVLKAKWYDLIELGEKKEEYREIKPYWIKRLKDENGFKKFDTVKFHYGYTNKTIEYEINEIVIDKGRINWGAEPEKEYFVIRLGKKRDNVGTF